MSDVNEIRPGVRAKLAVDLSRFRAGTDGIVGDLDPVYPVYHFWVWERLGWELLKPTAEQLEPLPFRPGDRVETSDPYSVATVVNCDVMEGVTPIHRDGSHGIDILRSDSLALIDYPGKEAP